MNPELVWSAVIAGVYVRLSSWLIKTLALSLSAPEVSRTRGRVRVRATMKVKVISILEDNYMYLVIEEQSKQAIAVDPAVPHRVRDTWNYDAHNSIITTN